MAAEGSFSDNGDIFNSHDTCSDGHSSVLQVDATPLSPNENDYDWKIQVTTGAGTSKDVPHNYSEGTQVGIRACVYEGSTKLRCSLWKFGRA
ncbi:hypothetical protein G6045_16345 [Streptomyces sp. YC504]|uniref:Uncharacterized protein n=1 Tax=Streptomyces mesophilus TaxID=1775132 RepID=A0A6G4XIH9_9ACTN|nr:hypothetical protein [Streptomyces mesophilus]NGO77218.1 hypothetical protein [Streptomyces mesophilus]